jgi:hypothetical protein
MEASPRFRFQIPGFAWVIFLLKNIFLNDMNDVY